MKFSDIDFSAISRIMDSMSDEEKDKLNDMAQNMMSDMQKPQESEEEEIDDFYAFLGIKEEDYQDLPGGVLDALEAACDLEQFYSEDPEADFSASILLSRAEYDFIRYEDLQSFKNLLIKEKGLLQIKELI